ncbi:putative aldehyde oxidase-like protein [Panicum miliaceum]|uniref:Aldehyde oxidase-like protein n=1 Tax=Panicum miliaceum TaxID=4540 RepID=A0A3L6QSN4_PANMI|nr:putative aldehyde oxidase-like protein [Panicum miliaceum]
MKGTSHPEYRISVAVGFLFSFLCVHVKGIADPGKTFSTSPDDSVDIIEHDSPLTSRQETISGDEYKPIGEPMKKYEVELQASGEAVYVDDIPAPKNCLHGEFIYSTQPLAFVKNITFKSSLSSQKIIAVVSAKDIPKEGQNIGSMSMFGDEPLFGDPITEFAGQALGVVIAETQRYADMAAKQVVVEYDIVDLKPPILTMEQAVQNNSYFNVPAVFYPKQVGDFSVGMAEADHKILSTEVKLASQYYFYMETQTALAIPDEDNTIVVYSSSQYPDLAQTVIAKCLGIPLGNVCVITRRVGGGFGGKAYRSFPVATAATLCAYKLRCPVRMYLNRNTDMIMVGSRHPMKAHYSVGFKSDGKITALHLDLLIDAGISEDLSPIIPSGVISALKKYNWGALSFDIKLCETNNTSKSSMRAPGDTQASAGEESTYTLHSIFNRLALTSSYRHRADTVKQFNICNKWRKRGISCVPLIFNVSPRSAPGRVSVLKDGSIVVQVGGIEIGQGLWTKVQQMTAFALGQLWPEGCEGLLERVRVLQADTLNLIQSGVTGGSSTSESSCAATLQACKLLISRLNPIMNKLRLQSATVSWDNLISQASQENVNLSASVYWVPEQLYNSYLNYGAGISEVEIDLITGAITILRSDLVYDCGMSLNPAVDLGQVFLCFLFFVFFSNMQESCRSLYYEESFLFVVPSILQKFYISFI